MAKKHHSVAIANTGSHAVIIYDLPRLYATDGDVKGGDSIECDTHFSEMPEVITL